MLKVLLVAPTVDGTDVGEAWVGYQWAARLSERHQVTLLTYRKRNRPSSVDQLPNVRVIEWTEPPVLGRSERFNSLLKPGYAVFYAQARRWLRHAAARGETFDVGHQPVPVAMCYPSPLADAGIPFVMGPVGGGLPSPQGFDAEDTAPWYVGLRRVDRWRLRHDPLLRNSYEAAGCIFAIAPYVDESLRGLKLNRLVHMSETGLQSVPPRDPPKPSGGPVRLLFVGRVVRTKGVRDAIRAMALLPDLPVVFDIVGDGYDREQCERLIDDLRLRDRVVMHGARPHAEVDAFYASADIFFFPSYREPGGNVVFEAMGHGLPMIVCRRGGPGYVVDDDCGIRVPATSPEDFARRLADAVRDLVTDPARRIAMAEAARAKVARAGLWEHRIETAERIYEDLVQESR